MLVWMASSLRSLAMTAVCFALVSVSSATPPSRRQAAEPLLRIRLGLTASTAMAAPLSALQGRYGGRRHDIPIRSGAFATWLGAPAAEFAFGEGDKDVSLSGRL